TEVPQIWEPASFRRPVGGVDVDTVASFLCSSRSPTLGAPRPGGNAFSAGRPLTEAVTEPVTVPTTTTPRAARRSVVSTAGPRTTIATAFVIARPVSKEPVEVISVKARKRWRLSHQGSPGTNARPV